MNRDKEMAIITDNPIIRRAGGDGETKKGPRDPPQRPARVKRERDQGNENVSR